MKASDPKDRFLEPQAECLFREMKDADSPLALDLELILGIGDVGHPSEY
jgi:hypothetical protein